MSAFKQNRAVSFVIIAIVYALGAVTGIALFRVLPYPWWASLFIADIAATLVTYVFSVLLHNASVYDPYWSVQPLVIVTAFLIGRPITLTSVCLLAVIGLWGVRLTANWAYTFGDLTHQDWRYTMLHQTTGVWYPVINLIGIHMVPTLIVCLCTLPAVYAVLHVGHLNIGFAVGLAVSVGAVVLQTTADIQMHRFRRCETGGFIRQGVWQHSRHPNYLGEILMWWGIGIAVVCVFPNAWHLLAGAIINTALFFFVSIPMADKRQSAKEGFAEYKAQTRVLLPIKK